jgi:hypothetical protein
MKCLSLAAAAVALAFAAPVQAWGPTGHQVIGALADAQLNPHAKAKVAQLIGMPLRTAGPWADCVKDVKGGPAHGHYVEDPNYKSSCGVFWTPAMEAEMVAYADRNWVNCNEPGEECHAQYHFADVAIERGQYQPGAHGTSDHDIEHAIVAAVQVLEGKPAPAPFKISGPNEALLMLAHLVGDLHQPLHVGSIYLNAAGQLVDPDQGTYNPATFTRGGNFLFDGTRKLHSEWDDVGPYPTGAIFASLLNTSHTIPVTPGPVESWPARWASETVAQAQGAFAGLTFTGSGAQKWAVHGADTAYAARKSTMQRLQVERAGARLAQILNAIWP